MRTLILVLALVATPALAQRAPTGANDGVRYQTREGWDGRSTVTTGSDGSRYTTRQGWDGRSTVTTGSNGFRQTCRESWDGRGTVCQ